MINRYGLLSVCMMGLFLAQSASAFTRYQVVRLVSHDNITSYEVMPSKEVQVLSKEIRAESPYFTRALKQTERQWEEKLDPRVPKLLPGLNKRKITVVKSSTDELDCQKWKANYDARLESERKDDYADLRKKVNAKFPYGGSNRYGHNPGRGETDRLRKERYDEEVAKMELKRSVLREAAGMLSSNIKAMQDAKNAQLSKVREATKEREARRQELIEQNRLRREAEADKAAASRAAAAEAARKASSSGQTKTAEPEAKVPTDKKNLFDL